MASPSQANHQSRSAPSWPPSAKFCGPAATWSTSTVRRRSTRLHESPGRRREVTMADCYTQFSFDIDNFTSEEAAWVRDLLELDFEDTVVPRRPERKSAMIRRSRAKLARMPSVMACSLAMNLRCRAAEIG